jgi:uncharacterized protein YwqG
MNAKLEKQRKTLEKLLAAAKLGPWAAKLAAQARPSISLVAEDTGNEDDLPLGGSKLGGRPDLPPGMSWPVRPAYADADKRVPIAAPPSPAPPPPPGLFGKIVDMVMGGPRLSNPANIDPEYVPPMARSAPLAFIAQIDLEALRPADRASIDLPDAGRLLFFYDTGEMPIGFDPADAVGSKLIWDTTPRGDLVRTSAPSGFATTAFGEAASFPAAALRSELALSPLSIGTDHIDKLRISKRARSQYEDFLFEREELEDSNTPQHQLGGWPNTLQGPMEIEAELVSRGYNVGDGSIFRGSEARDIRKRKTRWVLLLQIDSDSKTDMMWADAGILYVWIPAEELKARNFDKIWVTMQCM